MAIQKYCCADFVSAPASRASSAILAESPNVVWIGQPFFKPAFAALGVQCTYIRTPQSPLFWDDIVQYVGGIPELIVVADASRPPFVLGVEDFPCPTFFYAVDTHIHSWYPFYAQAFDACMVSLRDHCTHFYSRQLSAENVWWFPPYARDTDTPLDIPQTVDCLFVGHIDAELTPRRKLFFEALQSRVPSLVVCQGSYPELYPAAKIVLNYAEHGDLNFRVFEALGCGSCLITPQVAHGFDTLFTPGKDCIVFKQSNIDDSADKVAASIHALLQNPTLRTEHAQNGLARVNAQHRARHRALMFLEKIRTINASTVRKRRAQAPKIRADWLKMLYLLFAEKAQGVWRDAYLRASKGL